MAIISKVLGSHKRLKVLSPLWLNRLKIYACDMIKKVVNTFIILINGTLSFLLLSDDDGVVVVAGGGASHITAIMRGWIS